MTGILKQNKVM